jgi:hypothetical protein
LHGQGGGEFKFTDSCIKLYFLYDGYCKSQMGERSADYEPNGGVMGSSEEKQSPEQSSKILPSIKIDGFMLKPGSLENLVNTVKEVI